jgi:hypothetical protein
MGAPVKPKPDFFKLLFKQWQTWLILAILAGVIVVSIINASNQVVITGHEPLPQQSIQQAQPEAQPNTSGNFSGTIVDAFQQIAAGMGSWMSLIILLIVLGFIISLFIKLSNMFK